MKMKSSSIHIIFLMVILLCLHQHICSGMQSDDYFTLPKENIKTPHLGKHDDYYPHTRIHLDEKCRGKTTLGIGYQNYTPYVDSQWNIHSTSERISGIFPHILINMMRKCCPNTTVGYAEQMSSSYQIQNHFNKHTQDMIDIDISFPLYGQDGKNTKDFKGFPFIPIVTAPKIVLLDRDSLIEDVELRIKFVSETLLNAWPMLGFIMVSTCLAGLCMWILDWKSNPTSPTQTFIKGSWDGIWLAFITMTTVGYGDLYPKSVTGRLFSMFWITLGVILVSLLTALVSAALNQTGSTDIRLSGMKIGAVRGSIEYQVGVERNAKMVAYENHIDMLEGLLTDNDTESLHFVMVDNFVLTAMVKKLNERNIRVKKELSYPVTYGMVLVQPGTTEKCFRQYVRNHSQEVFESIASKLDPVGKLAAEIVEVSAIGKLFYEQPMFKNMVYAECLLLVLAVVVGLMFEALYLRKAVGRQMATKCQVIDDCVGSEHTEESHALEESICREKHFMSHLPKEMKELVNDYNEYHNEWLKRVEKVYRSSGDNGNESVHSLITNVS